VLNGWEETDLSNISYHTCVSNPTSPCPFSPSLPSFQDLKDFFRYAGEISYANAHSPRTGEGIIEFCSRRGVEAALERKDDLELDGRRLKIKADIREDSRSRSRSYSRSGSSRSRSRYQCYKTFFFFVTN
jgi:RNA recognition motif-containing protein